MTGTAILLRSILLIGAGGHAKVVCDALHASGRTVGAYVDPRAAAWLDLLRFESDEAALADEALHDIAIGLGGVTPAALEARYAVMKRYQARGRSAPAIVDPRGALSGSAMLAPGAQALVGSIVNANAQVGEGAIVNTRAVVEHDARVGRGTHVAPGAIVLGGADVGEFCMIGAGAIVLPGVRIADRTLIPARALYQGETVRDAVGSRGA